MASGVVFEYAGQEYRISLLTAADVILDNNAFLSAKITIIIMMLLIFVIVMVAFMAFGVFLDRLRGESEALNAHIEEQNMKIEDLDQEVLHMEQFSTRWNAYNVSVLPTFLEKLRDRGAYPIRIKKLSFDKPASRDEFLEHAQMLLDKKVLRFTTDSDTELVLVFIEFSDRESKEALDRIQTYGEWKVVKEQGIGSGMDMDEVDEEFFS